jgi:hypothetical protein
MRKAKYQVIFTCNLSILYFKYEIYRNPRWHYLNPRICQLTKQSNQRTGSGWMHWINLYWTFSGLLHAGSNCIRPYFFYLVDERKLPFLSISASDSKFNPQNTQCILKVKFFIFLELNKKFSFSANLYLWFSLTHKMVQNLKARSVSYLNAISLIHWTFINLKILKAKFRFKILKPGSELKFKPWP